MDLEARGTTQGQGLHHFSKASQSLPGENKARDGMPGEVGSSTSKRALRLEGLGLVRDWHWQQDGAGQLINTQPMQGLCRCPQSPGEDLGGGKRGS